MNGSHTVKEAHSMCSSLGLEKGEHEGPDFMGAGNQALVPGFTGKEIHRPDEYQGLLTAACIYYNGGGVGVPQHICGHERTT